MPNIRRNLKILQEDCGEVCNTSDDFEKRSGKYFDILKKFLRVRRLIEDPLIWNYRDMIRLEHALT